jgi:archaetidylinositol phosphate synthase
VASRKFHDLALQRSNAAVCGNSQPNERLGALSVQTALRAYLSDQRLPEFQKLAWEKTVNDTWSHVIARFMVRPLIGTGIRPNHVTSLRLISGIIACGLLALGTRNGDIWGGVLWVVSVFLDRADGELARIGNMQSHKGHLYDYYTDVLINSLLFLGVGFGQQHSFLGAWSIPLGVVTFVAMILCSCLAHVYEQISGPGVRTFKGGFGFHVDDALYLFGPFAWLGWLAPILGPACLGSSIMVVVIAIRLIGLKRRVQAGAEKVLAVQR